MSPANNFLYLLQHLARVLDKQVGQVLQKQVGIGLSQFRILSALEWNPRVSQRNIAASLGLTEAGVSRQVKLLTAKGLLASKPDSRNRRRHIIAPTPRGMQVTETANATLRRSFGTELSGLGDNALLGLSADLQKLHATVCKPGKPGACSHALGL